MEFKHTSVLFQECLDFLNIKKNGIYIDGTLGGGGHASGICERLDETGILIGLDRDKEALFAASRRLEKYPCTKIYLKRNYVEIAQVLSELKIDKVSLSSNFIEFALIPVISSSILSIVGSS